MVQIGLMFEGQDGLNWDNWKQMLKTAEESGYQCVFRSDHFTNATGIHKDALELWASLTYAAAVTKQLEIGCLVTPITFRHPAMIVQSALAVDVLSEGRLVLGLGTGWQDREHREFGIDFPPLAERYERLQDALEITERLLNNDAPVSYDGKHYELDGALLTMKRKGTPRILIGGNGKTKTLPLVARYATEWNAVYTSHADFKERNALLNEYLAEHGRKPSDVKRSLMMRVIYGKTDADVQAQLANMSSSKEDLIKRGLIVGTGSEIVDQIGAWAEVGVERFMLQWLSLDNPAGVESMAQDILPHFHQ